MNETQTETPAKTPVPWSRRAYQPFDAACNSCGMIANTTQNNQFAEQERSMRDTLDRAR
jgi:hypothetical protein